MKRQGSLSFMRDGVPWNTMAHYGTKSSLKFYPFFFFFYWFLFSSVLCICYNTSCCSKSCICTSWDAWSRCDLMLPGQVGASVWQGGLCCFITQGYEAKIRIGSGDLKWCQFDHIKMTVRCLTAEGRCRTVWFYSMSSEKSNIKNLICL